MVATPHSPIFEIARGTGPTPLVRRSLAADDWLTQSVKSAVVERLDNTPHYCGLLDGEAVFRCRHSAKTASEHTLILNLEHGTLRCDCWDFQRGYPCADYGAMLVFLQRVAESGSPNHRASWALAS